MTAEVFRTDYETIAPLRDLYLAGLDCQVVHGMVLPRGLADPYLIRVEGRSAAYGATWNSYYPGRVVEFFCTSTSDLPSEEAFRALLVGAQATSIEAQTNMPIMYSMLRAFGGEPREDKILFEDGGLSSLPNPGATLAELTRSATGSEWALQIGNETVAKGGYMTHYNPPFADIYMEVEEHARGRGLGSYLVQELKRVCYDRGFRPAARCDPDNHPSRRSLERAAFRECARLLSSEVEHGR